MCFVARASLPSLISAVLFVRYQECGCDGLQGVSKIENKSGFGAGERVSHIVGKVVVEVVELIPIV